MDIIVRKQSKSVFPFALSNLPDLVVLTGENGTGKTQLLDYLCQATKYSDEGTKTSENEADYPISNFPFGDKNTDAKNGIVSYTHPAEIDIDGNRVTNVVLRGVQAPTIDVGGKIDLKKIYENGEAIAQKFLFYKTHSEIYDFDTADSSTLSTSFNKVLGIKRGSRQSQDAEYPELTKEDIETIKKIDEAFSEVDYSKIPFYYIAILQIPNTSVFSANLKFLYFQYWARLRAGLTVDTKPWEVFNHIGEVSQFKFELDEPKVTETKFEAKNFDVRLRDKTRKFFISPDSLSSGEKVMFSLFVAMYTSNISEQHPSVILFDEPDAYLHPSLSGMMLKVLREVFILKYGIKVILTTHSPSTVALVPEDSLFRMDKDTGTMVKSTKKEAILSLTTGLNTLSIYYENVKQIFVEADNDNKFLSQVFHHALSMQMLNPDIQLKFVNVGNDKNGGCSIVKKVVNELAGAENQTVYGIIDWDGKNCDSDRIKVLGNGSRYAIDNYYADPIAMAMLFLQEPAEKIKIGFESHDSITTFCKMNVEAIQNIINYVISALENVIPPDDRTDIALTEYAIADGRIFKLPHWFMAIQGHQIVDYYKTAFPFLNKYRTDKDILKNIYNAYDNCPGIIPMDIINTLKSIQEA